MKTIPTRTDNEMIGSASVTALMRYLLSKKTGLAKNPDYLGNLFVAGKWKEYLNYEPKVAIEKLQIILPGCIYYHLIRTKHFDASLIKWIELEKNSQVIILGAGFDSRALRFKKSLKENNIKIYEVDLKAMLEHKQGIIERHNKATLEHVVYTPCNFQKDNIIEKLLEYNFNFSKPTLILWEGVTYFLTQGMIENSLKLFKKNMNNKLQITLDYAFRDYIDGDLNFYGAKEIYDILIELGEPHLFGLNYDEVESYFNGNGYAIKSNYSAFMLEALYLRERFGESVGKPHEFNGMTEIIAHG